MPDLQKVELVLTSPPYFAGKEYETYLESYSEYLSLLDTVWRMAKVSLKDGCQIVVNIAHTSQHDTPAFVSVQLFNSGFIFEDNIIWEKPDGASPRFGCLVQNPFSTWYLPNHTHENLLVYSQGEPRRERKNQLDMAYALRFRGDVWRLRSETNSKHEAPFPERLVAPPHYFLHQSQRDNFRPIPRLRDNRLLCQETRA
jgi:DNA modification methylase